MPAQYVAKKFWAGGLKGSIFNLMAACLGAGILTLPYTVYANGLILGPLLIIIAALLSYYSGYLLVIIDLDDCLDCIIYYRLKLERSCRSNLSKI